MNKGKILVVDDNNGIRATLKLLLTKYFKEVRLASTPNVINAELRDFAPDVVLLDMNFVSSANTGNEGLFWLSEIKKSKPETEVVLFTAYADISLAVEGMKRGAFDFVVKPWDNDKLIETLNGAYAMGISRLTGSVTAGKLADLIITRPLPDLAFIPYSHHTPFISRIILKGKEL